MSRNVRWLTCVVLLLGAPGCLGTTDQVGSNDQALSLADLRASDCGSVAAELETGDCVQAGRVAQSLGHDVVWAVDMGVGRALALLEIDGVVSCSARVESLSLEERTQAISLHTLSARPDPEPANPDESRPDPEPANPDESRPDPEPATGSGSNVDDDDGTTPDQNRPDPEPAGGGTTTTVATTF